MADAPRARARDRDDVGAAVDALLAAGRPREALALADNEIAQRPDDVEMLVLRATCLLDLDQPHAAERAWARATAIRPDHVGGAVLGIRCALALRLVDAIWPRAERLSSMASPQPATWFWLAIAAAATGRHDRALELVALQRASDAGGEWELRTGAEVDLIIGARTGRVAKVAEAAADTLLGRDPLDQYAHRLRLRAAALHDTVRKRPRRGAERRLQYVADAARAGVQPRHGELGALVVRAATPLAPTVLWIIAMFFATALVKHVRWYAVFAAGSAIGVVVYVLGARRVRRVAAKVPAGGRVRLLRPVARTMSVAAIALATIATLMLVVLTPLTAAHGIKLGFGRGKERTTTVVIPGTPITLPPFVMPTFDDPSLTLPVFTPVTRSPTSDPAETSSMTLPGGSHLPVPTFPVVTRPPVTMRTPKVSIPGIPEIRTVVVVSPDDPRFAYDLIHYYAATCVAVVALSGALVILARSLVSRRVMRSG